ncbi:MAG TPA: hydroxysqualene dehydroxylase HpnE, partial [Verrucomicrobiae bacterium]|nr:hydroxysqualene dehydroxylase HpnE [Verrucomicrobiae bacterium]
AAAAALAQRGFRVHVLERKSIPGGRASSYEAQDTGEPVDNCQHILMGCCTNLRRFYAHAGVEDRIRWVSCIRFLDRRGRVWALRGSRLPAPFHLMPSFMRLGFLAAADRWRIAAGLMAMLRAPAPKEDLPFAEWLRAHHQTAQGVARFWRPIVVSALNEEPERCSTRYAFQVFRQGFLGHPRAYEMGVPRVPLRELYGPCVDAVRRAGGCVAFRCAARALRVEKGAVTGVELDDGRLEADYVISAVPFEEARRLLPEPVAADPSVRAWDRLEVSPISAVHLWWDREVTALDHVALVDRPIHWAFNKTRDFGRDGPGTYLGLVVSASRDWLPLSRREILEIAEAEVRAALPGTAGAQVVKAAVIKEARATFSPVPGVDALRPPCETPIRNLFLAGDWVRSGWPATMEGAVRSGYRAAERVLAAEGRAEAIRVPDLPWQAIVGAPGAVDAGAGVF